MNKKQHHIIFQHIFGENSGTWVLILVHLMILVSLIALFSEIISRMQNY